MKVRSNSLYIFFVGFALFSMFFGAYNLAFPLVMGQQIPLSNLPLALVGSFVSFIALPIFGFYGIAVYEGDKKEFFQKLGKIFGFLLLCLVMLFFGPLGVLARCMGISFLFVKGLCPWLSIQAFTLLFCFLVFLCATRKSFMMNILGKVLAPILFLSLVGVTLYALLTPVDVSFPILGVHPDPFRFGFLSGYFSLSFLMGFLFCYLVANSMKKVSLHDQHLDKQLLLHNDVRSMLWASCLLFIVSCGLAYTASKFSGLLHGVSIENILPTLLLYLFGDHGSLITFVIVLLTCFTTAVPLASIFSDFLRREVLREKISYQTSLALTLLVGYFVAITDYTQLFYSLAALLDDLLPGFIALTALNVAHKVFHKKISKVMTLIVFLGTVLVARSFL